MSTLAINVDLITGWFPQTVVIVAIASVVLSVGWHDGAWKWQLPIGIPISFVLTVLTGVAIHVFNLVPSEFPTSFYLWAWLIWYSVVIIVLGWTRAHWILRTFSVIALVFSILAAFTVINQNYDYYPTLARLLGKSAANFTDLPQLKAIRDEVRRTGKLPTHGETIEVTIPATISKFNTGQAYVYLPPVWFKNPEPQLPLIELIAGVPGEPSDWTRAGYADTTSTAFAEQHHGVAPLLVIPDNNGNLTSDSECSNSVFGNSETYLIKDVPNYMQSEFNAAIGKHAMAVAGLSAGGTCSTMLALRNPQTFSTFASYSGYASPTYENDNAQQTIDQLYGGSKANYEAHNPVNLLTGQKYPGSAGWFTAGQSDPQPLAASHQLASLARKTGMQVCESSPPGDHSFTFWAAAFRLSLPWLSWRLGLTPPPASVPAHCVPPVP
ncbi:MAG: alpha/beta hydrolase-fold protein [Acidimicrobiales bacterium]|jgi:enterochelin esterase-like enzyme